MEKYRTFIRTWRKENPAWPNGLEPGAGPRKFTGNSYESEEAARAACREYNRMNPPGRLSLKMEYE
jgi:hypothetical protein